MRGSARKRCAEATRSACTRFAAPRPDRDTRPTDRMFRGDTVRATRVCMSAGNESQLAMMSTRTFLTAARLVASQPLRAWS
jgi:hypothetical protein